MGKRTKLREAERDAADQALADRLRTHQRRSSNPSFITSYEHFSASFRRRIDPYLSKAIRDPEQWHSTLRVRSPELRFLEFVRYAFATFDVAPCLERAWLPASAVEDDGGPDDPDFRDWYITAAQGRSLYKEAAKAFLSRSETHHFLAAPEKVGSARTALWYAIAMAACGEPTLALKIARTELARLDPRDGFWKEAARFLARESVSTAEMQALIEYLGMVREAEPDFSFVGRSAAALLRRRQDWLWLCAAGAEARDIRWQGLEIADGTYAQGATVWRIHQIKTGIRLLEEARRMRHCVFAYRRECSGGHSSIWSVSSEEYGVLRRHLTIEVGANGAVLQCRGFANREPTEAERRIVRRWAADRALCWLDELEPYPAD